MGLKHYTYKNMPVEILDKDRSASYFVDNSLRRAMQMFKVEGLPESIPERMFKLFLLTHGHIFIMEHEGKLYAFKGDFSGEPDAYYRPTKYVIANPGLGFSGSFDIGKDGEVVLNDSVAEGLLPMFRRYATQLVENEISILDAQINCRIQALISAEDERTRKSAEEFLANIVKGRLGIISETAMIEALKSKPYSSASNAITQLIELEQYLKGSLANELGLDANYNMKRERISEGETQMNGDMLLPYVDDMLACWRDGAERVNKMFGTNITIEKTSAWENREAILDASEDENENEGKEENANDDEGNTEVERDATE